MTDLTKCGEACNCARCRAVAFSMLKDGQYFIPTELYVYGSMKVFQKTMEDGGNHNAVVANNTNQTIKFNMTDWCIPVNKPEV